MPVSELGQMISFAIDQSADQSADRWIFVNVRKGDTVQKISSNRGHPEQARKVADANGIRSVKSVLTRKQLKVPSTFREAGSLHVLAGDQPPRVVDGYAKLTTIDRPERVGVTVFEGYNPVTLEVPVRFENFRRDPGVDIEEDCALLELMAGRGKGAGSGPPPVIRVSTTGATGQTVPLIGSNYQWSLQNPSAPLWRVAGIDWDAEPIRHTDGTRLRQLAVVTLQQHTRVDLLSRSVTSRARTNQGYATEMAADIRRALR